MLYWDIDFKLKNKYMRRQTEGEIIDQVLDLWYDDNFITENEIIKAFKDSGVASEINDFGEKYDNEISEKIIEIKNENGHNKRGNSIIENALSNNDDKIFIY